MKYFLIKKLRREYNNAFYQKPYLCSLNLTRHEHRRNPT